VTIILWCLLLWWEKNFLMLSLWITIFIIINTDSGVAKNKEGNAPDDWLLKLLTEENLTTKIINYCRIRITPSKMFRSLRAYGLTTRWVEAMNVHIAVNKYRDVRSSDEFTMSITISTYQQTMWYAEKKRYLSL